MWPGPYVPKTSIRFALLKPVVKILSPLIARKVGKGSLIVVIFALFGPGQCHIALSIMPISNYIIIMVPSAALNV